MTLGCCSMCVCIEGEKKSIDQLTVYKPSGYKSTYDIWVALERHVESPELLSLDWIQSNLVPYLAQRRRGGGGHAGSGSEGDLYLLISGP